MDPGGPFFMAIPAPARQGGFQDGMDKFVYEYQKCSSQNVISDILVESMLPMADLELQDSERHHLMSDLDVGSQIVSITSAALGRDNDNTAEGRSD